MNDAEHVGMKNQNNEDIIYVKDKSFRTIGIFNKQTMKQVQRV